MSDENHTQSSGVKIQINSVKALERLIGGDSELEIEIRNNIVQEFTRKHLKDIVNTDLVSQQSRIIQQEITNKVTEISSIGICNVSRDGWGRTVLTTLKDDVKKQIEVAISVAIDQKIRDSVELYTSSTDFTQKIQSYVNTFAFRKVEEEVKNKIKAALTN